MGPQEVQRHHWSTDECPVLHLPQVYRQVSAHWPMTQVDVEGTKLDVEDTFCYQGDMLCSGSGCDSVIADRWCMAWEKFSKLLPVLTSRHLSPKVHGKVYTACVCSAMLHGSETWGPNILDLKRLCHNDQWSCHGPLDLWYQRPSWNILSLTTPETWH